MSSNLIKSFGLIAIGAISGVTFTHFYYKGYQGSDVPDLTPRYTKFDSAGRALESIYDFNATKFFQYGIPGPVADQRVNHGYMSVFDRRTRNPFYVSKNTVS